jgi:hypothetical protein
MRVLLLESDRHGADDAERALRLAGHEVVRCHEPDLGSFPCNALCDEGTCPVDDDRGVDVALTMRSHSYPGPTDYEDGVSCALRQGVPLVVGGVTAMNPFDRFTTTIVTDDSVVEACENAVATPVEHLAAPARAEVRRRLAAMPDVAIAADVKVHRHGRQLVATVMLPGDADEVDGQLAVAVAGVLRARDRGAKRIDVTVERREPTRSA